MVFSPNGLLWFPRASTRVPATLTRCPDALLYSSWNRTVDTPSSSAAMAAELQSVEDWPRQLDRGASSSFLDADTT